MFALLNYCLKLVVESEVRRDWVSLRSLLVRDINRFSQELRWGSLDNVTGLKVSTQSLLCSSYVLMIGIGRSVSRNGWKHPRSNQFGDQHLR